MKRLLIIEDDPAVVEGLKASLTQEHFDVLVEITGEGGFKKAKEKNIDLIILDLILPDRDGIDICRALRNDGINTPIIMLTGRKEELDKVLGFEIGADDYVTKPFSVRELIARIKAVLRRKSDLTKDIDEYSFGGVHVDFKKQIAHKKNVDIQLSTLEFKILKYFILHEGEVISRDKLLDDAWGYEAFPSTRTVDNYILSLRKKIEDEPNHPKHILTIYKAGYKFID
jgi:DNA-binding response OmpR family regulator